LVALKKRNDVRKAKNPAGASRSRHVSTTATDATFAVDRRQHPFAGMATAAADVTKAAAAER